MNKLKYKSLCITKNKNKKVTINPFNAYTISFPNHLLLPFLEQPWSDKIILLILPYAIYKCLVQHIHRPSITL